MTGDVESLARSLAYGEGPRALLLPREWVLAHPSADAAWQARTECVLDLRHRKNESLRVSITVRFLDVTSDAPREVTFGASLDDCFGRSADSADEVGPAHVEADFTGTPVRGVLRIRVVVENLAPCAPASTRAEAERLALSGVHVILAVEPPLRWVSAISPPADLAEVASGSTNAHLWPVLVGADDATIVALPRNVGRDHPAKTEAPSERALKGDGRGHHRARRSP